jgi:transcription-repair coupling factor (superfamily II helicase)
MIGNILQDRFIRQEPCRELSEWINTSGKGSVVLNGLYSSSKAFAMASAMQRGLHLVLLNNPEDAAYCAGDLSSLLDKESVFYFPSSKSVKERRDPDVSSFKVQRTAALKAVNDYINGKENTKRVVLAGFPQSIIEKVVTGKKLSSSVLSISKGDSFSHEFIKETLIACNFRKVDFVQEPGEFALRGGIIDLFSYSENHPFRVDFFGDTVESISIFDADTQRSAGEVDSVDIFPDIYENNVEEEVTDIFSFGRGEFICWITDPDYFNGKLESLESEMKGWNNEEKVPLPVLHDSLQGGKRILFGPVSKIADNIPSIDFHTTPQPAFNKNFELLAKEISLRTTEGFKVIILCGNTSQSERLEQIFLSIEDYRTEFETEIISLHEGFTDHISKICIFTDHQIFDRYHRVKTSRSIERSERLTINELNSFRNGDYIVHIDHGVGQFGGLVKTSINGRQQEAVKLVYKDGDVIFVSIHGLHRISRYKSADSQPPKIYKLGTGAWQKLKNQTKSKVKDIAKELIALYAKRREVNGFAFSHDSYMQQELEASFIYEDTPDQIKATTAVKEDMEKDYPMDRLICGDVGFGKTEIAVRAAFKAVSDSKQVALLVPTTILALQHYKTFTGRLKDFPCNIEYISRLKSTAEIKEITGKLKEGRIDIIIGTHRLLNKEILFKDLGLLVIDEEQKFGVAAKERLRQMKLNVDTLTLTATPIPRTLQFSLLGARDLSVINTPPPNRLPIQTEIVDFNENVIREAINFEVERGGQVFFVHNRVEDILAVEDIIKRLCPKVKSCIGHGQMSGEKLEKIMLDFISGDYDLLLATTIVENGIDIPNANTIIINQAQNFGLSDLHQLRGRVGRSNKKAFCYLIVPPLISLSDDARRRLKAIESFSDLGSGFNIAMQDLDIRGAGNLLGGEQSGFIADMGFETYQRILSEAFSELMEEAGETNAAESARKSEFITDCTIDTDLEILIPDSYINITAEKIRLYKELDAIQEEKGLIDFREELSDRYGAVPQEVDQLIYTVRLRKLAIGLGFEKIILKNGIMLAYFISNQLSPYYKSEKFAAILGYFNQSGGKIKLKEQREKLYISVDRVESVQDAYNILSRINEGS